MILRVLIIDPAPFARARLAHALAMCGVRALDIVQCATLGDASAALGDTSAQLVCTTFAGAAAARSHAALSQCPLIVVTAERSRPRLALLEAARGSLLQKPFTPESLRTIIASLSGTSAGGDHAA